MGEVEVQFRRLTIFPKTQVSMALDTSESKADNSIAVMSKYIL